MYESQHCRLYKGAERHGRRVRKGKAPEPSSSTTTMDRPLDPPPRIMTEATRDISARSAHKRVQSFLDNFHSRGTARQEANMVVTVQLQKLADALKAERT